MQRRVFVGMAGFVMMATATALAQPAAAPDTYQSPYTVKFTYPLRELIGDLEAGPRGRLQEEAAVPFHEWYARHTEKKFGAWGPPARHFPPAPGAAGKPLAWKRERLLATALRFQGYGYQHHHVPDWNPPANWPWKHTAVGHNGKGVDCSNFSAFAYNLAFGIKPSGAVKKQAEELEIPGPGEGRFTRAELIPKPASYAGFAQALQTGDLLYVRNRSGELAHVVIWVGSVGESPDGVPLILDSHGEGVKDANGVSIPCGIHLRPFRDNSWYHHSASHAHRILH